MVLLNKLNYMQLIPNLFVLLTSTIVVKTESKMTSEERTCKENIQKLCSCPNSAEAINCARIFISNLHKFDITIEYLKEFYFEFFYNLDTTDIESPATFCANKGSKCLSFLEPFGSLSLTAAQYALYDTKLDSIVQKGAKGLTIIEEACNEECYLQEKFKQQFGNQYGSSFNEKDVQKEYIMHIMDNIKLTENQKSPSKFCKDKFNPGPGYKAEHEELFELKNIKFK